MPHAAAFDQEKFAAIMKAEVEDIARRQYGDQSTVNLGKAFTFWCIKNISTESKEDDIELARAICEAGGPGDENIDGAWIDAKREALFVIQAKYSEIHIPSSEDNTFRVPSFSADAAEQLDQGFTRVRKYVDHEFQPSSASRKLLELVKLYQNALDKRLRINVVLAISGKPTKGLLTKVDELNSVFEQNRRKYEKHHCIIYDLDVLNQIVSDNLALPPTPQSLDILDRFTLRNNNDTIYAIAATVDAKRLVELRDKCGYSIYHSNFRFLLTRGGVARPKIEKTLEDDNERRNFWRYNNGITITCETVEEVNPTQLRITGLQVVNGLQTIEALYDNRNRLGWLDGVRLLLRIIPTKGVGVENGGARQLEEHIAEYSNSQTPIRPRDLRSNDAVQIEIERILSENYNLKYVRKVGESPGLRGRPSRKRVDNEEAAQAGLSFWYGLSQEAKAKRKLIFEKASSAIPGYYEKIFNDDTAPEYVLLPYLFYDNEYDFIGGVGDKVLRGIYRSLDLLAISVVGDAFKASWGLAAEPTRAEKSLQVIRSAIRALKDAEDGADRLWRPLFRMLHEIVEKRRRIEARNEGVEFDQIQPRNIIIKMRFSDTKLKQEISRKPATKLVRRLVKETYIN